MTEMDGPPFEWHAPPINVVSFDPSPSACQTISVHGLLPSEQTDPLLIRPVVHGQCTGAMLSIFVLAVQIAWFLISCNRSMVGCSLLQERGGRLLRLQNRRSTEATRTNCCSSKSRRCNWQRIGRSIPPCEVENALVLVQFIDDVCRLTNVNYFVTFGTALGVASNQSHLPFQSDMDIAIPFNREVLLKQAFSAFIKKHNHHFELVESEQSPLKLYFSKINRVHVNIWHYVESERFVSIVHFHMGLYHYLRVPKEKPTFVRSCLYEGRYVRCLVNNAWYVKALYGLEGEGPLLKYRSYRGYKYRGSSADPNVHLVTESPLRFEELDLSIIQCVGGEGRHSMPFLSGMLQLYHLLLKSGISVYVHSGTLLHLYRNCTLLPDTNDIDFAIPLEEMVAVRGLLQTQGYDLHEIGRETEVGYEVSVSDGKGTKYDFFSINDIKDTPWTPQWVKGELRMCPMKHFDSSALLLVERHVFRVPLNIEDQLVALYGENWRNPIPSKNWNWKNPRCKPHRMIV